MRSAYPLTVEKVRMTCVKITRFHSDQVLDQLIGWIHGLLEECDDDLVELLLQRRISPKHGLGEKSGKDSYKFVVDQGSALQAWLLQPFDLLLDNHFKGGSVDEECWRRSR